MSQKSGYNGKIHHNSKAKPKQVKQLKKAKHPPFIKIGKEILSNIANNAETIDMMLKIHIC